MAVISGGISDEEGRKSYFIGKKKRAICNLANFPSLTRFCLGFDFLDETNHEKNAFFNFASWEGSGEILESLEMHIVPVINGFTKVKKMNTLSKLKAVNNQSHQLFNEWKFYLDLSKNDNVTSIEYENSKNGNHDFRIWIGETIFDIELTSLGETPLQKKIQDGFEMASRYILERIPERIYLQIDLDLNKVPLSKDVSSEEIRDFIISSYNELEPIILVNQDGLCRIESFGGLEGALWSHRDMFVYYNEFGQRLSALSETNEGQEFLKNTVCENLAKNPFESCIISPGRYSLIEIHSVCVHPSIAESLRKESLINQLRRNVLQKITKGQLKGKINPIIALNFEDFAFMHYWDSSDYFFNEGFEELRRVIQNVFKENGDTKILGVLLFEGKLSMSRFVGNPNIGISEDVPDKIILMGS